MSRAQTVGIVRYYLWITFCALAHPFAPAPALAQVQATVAELPRAGAPRPLRLLAPDGSPLRGIPTDVTWERRGGGLFFTLEREGTRNIWRAFPDAQDGSRFPAWRALPVTNLRAPFYAAQPHPLPGDRALVCVSNALASASASAAGGIAQIARYDMASAQFRALSDKVRFYDAPQVSPDGARVAFVGGQGAEASVFVASTGNPLGRVLPVVTPLVAGARRPVWLDNNSLLIENLAPGKRGLYWLQPQSAGAPRVVVGGGGEANALGASGIVFSAKTSAQSPPNLYLVARDGSGLRILNETAGARRPAAAPDGLTLAYDAPLTGARQGAERALWVVPLVRPESSRVNAQIAPEPPPPYEVPTAQLSSARVVAGGIAIVGSLRGAANSTILLEVGQGEKPRRFETVPVPFPPTTPLLDAEGNRVLATWNPPPRARGVYTLRLSLSGLGGGAQSLLRVKLPLPPQANLPELPVVPPPANAPDEPFPRATPLPNLPDVVPNRGASATLPPPFAIPPVSDPDDLPAFPMMPPPQTSLPPMSPNVRPIPSINPPPTTVTPPAPGKTPTTVGTPIVPIDPRRIGAPSPSPVVPDDGDYGEMPTAGAGEPWVAQFNVSGTPAQMEPGERVKVTFWGLNRGSSSWQTGASGPGRVRVVARWVDFSTGTRRQWNFFWLREAVAPGQRTKWEFDLPAPARPGKYKLIYGLVHLPERGEYSAPAYSAPQELWPDEFGAIAFAVEVAPDAASAPNSP